MEKLTVPIAPLLQCHTHQRPQLISEPIQQFKKVQKNCQILLKRAETNVIPIFFLGFFLSCLSYTVTATI
jgi:hypothetical protein